MIENSYLWLKTIHIVAAVFFLGNIIITGWWKNMADRTKNPQIIAFAQRQVTLTDFIFTAGGALILFAAGLSNVVLHHLTYSAKWLTHGVALFTFSGIIWAFILIPVQVKQAKMAKIFAIDGVIPIRYWKLCTIWNIFGLVATILPLMVIYWMVFKPQ